jgi:hypothetical protein
LIWKSVAEGAISPAQAAHLFSCVERLVKAFKIARLQREVDELRKGRKRG